MTAKKEPRQDGCLLPKNHPKKHPPWKYHKPVLFNRRN